MAIYKNPLCFPYVFLVVVVLSMIFSSRGFAQNSTDDINITPSHVYQSTEELRLKLGDLGLIDMQVYEEVLPNAALRHPRHVMQKVRECHQIISKILVAKNIEPEPVPRLFSFREIRPSDVKNGVEHLLKEVSKLGGAPIEPVTFVEGKLPNDVFNNLKRICHALNIAIVPADVYRVAYAVRENMEQIARSQAYDLDRPEKSFDSKVPSDVYWKTWEFLDDLRVLALNPDYAIPGGIIIPSKHVGGQIVPGDVIALMNDALAGTDAIKYTLGVREETALPSYQPDKTPSDVFGEVYHAHLIVKGILELEEKLDHEGDQ